MAYQYLIFDLDDTLLDFKGGEVAGLKNVFAQQGFNAPLQEKALSEYTKINRGLWSSFEKGEISKQTIHQTRFDKLLNTLGIAGDGSELERQYREELNHNYRVIDGAEPFLADLQQAGYHLIAGTNGEAQTQHLRLAHTGLDQYFEHVYISDEMGVAKPDPAFYQEIFAENPDMTKDNTVMIGDGLASDIQGGVNFGIDTIWVNFNQRNTTEPPMPTAVAQSYSELKQKL
ncbi:noncanonical pyrimidine nucleotidase, YjjG family [Weissella viridescens]|uniref:Noncanonical pyrimidine nucleotidase, YjjG family n=1 Tax=Weissella viridescens TaxID=1629 RepID=A0A3P2RC04_WEIVI|nr:YjjG family noncanonical pyrimidine nucleotidase [Weissella viridescens]RRG18279.1 noncanonical pyrimidine nucleotidase, YjjG family [Weissella viridescens]